MPVNLKSENDEINLFEILAALWAHKIIIVLLTTLSVFISGYYLVSKTKKFTASAIFQIEQQNNTAFNVSGELGALASLAGFGGDSASSTATLFERVKTREFILRLKNKSLLEYDPYFNTYDPNSKDPFWKAKIKELLGWQKTKAERNDLIENTIIKNYQSNVNVGNSDGGAIVISVTHIDPTKAANYANTFMEQIKNLVQQDSDAAQELRLSYLSETLADALQDMELAQKNLKDYALKNSALAQENFISGSLQLDEIRMERRKVGEIESLLSILDTLVKSRNIDSSTYDALRSNYPLVDDIDFRRILGMSETISAWTWPNIETLEAVRATLKDRIKRLDIEIKNIEENAKIYADSAEDLAKFTRDATIAEATYTVLIEQVKSQALAAGFKADTFKVFEYATPPLFPSSPNRSLIVGAGATLGLLLSIILSLINASRRGVYYTNVELISDANASLSKFKKIRRLSKKTISKIKISSANRRIQEAGEAQMKLANKKLVYVSSYGARLSASEAVRFLATQVLSLAER